MGAELVLVVEDKETNRKLVRDVLQFRGYEVAEAETAEEGLRMVQERRPDLILMDIHLPGMDGIEALKRLRADPATCDIPVIFVAADPNLEKMGQAGGDDLVAKPISREGLLEALRKHVPMVERAAPRVPALLRVRLEEGGGRRNVFSKDLSQDGIFLKTERPLPVGTQIELRFRLPLEAGTEDLSLHGEVVRQVSEVPSSHLIAGIGVRFLNMRAAERLKVGQFIRSRLVPA